MKTRLLTAALVFMGAAALFPSSTAAFEVTGTSATRLTPEHVLFTISYQFGFLNRELLMPVMADRTGERRGTTVGYTLTDKDGDAITSGATAAIVLSEAELRDRQYYVPKGRNGDFTLAVLVRTTGMSDDMRLTMTRLPFTLVDGTVSLGAAVTAEQMTDYQTDLIR